MEERKQRERDFHDKWRGELQPTGDPRYNAYRKWYTAGQHAEDWLVGWLRCHSAGKDILDLACGEGDMSIRSAKAGGTVTGIDLSNTSIELARRKAGEAGVTAAFQVGDAENTGFPSQMFDIVICAGVLHHMDPARAFREVARVLKSDGTVIALEALGHNPLINLYRRLTPYLRSPDERPLRMEEIEIAREYFEQVELRFFNLMTLAAAPLWRTPLCKPAVSFLQAIDSVLLRIPGLRRHAWMVGLLLKKPKSAPVVTMPSGGHSLKEPALVNREVARP